MSKSKDHQPYFYAFLNAEPPQFRRLTSAERSMWHLFAGATIGFGIWYLFWRWTSSLNPDAIIFSTLVAAAETAAFLGTALFFFDIWDEGDTPNPPTRSFDLGGQTGKHSDVSVDIFITTYDEESSIVAPTIDAAAAVRTPSEVSKTVIVLDDGDRDEMRQLAKRKGIKYLSRCENRGFKAGNLANAMLRTNGDYIVICDADTQLFSSFLEQTLGYFSDPAVSWVQTPHWFYDLATSQSWSDLLPAKCRKLAIGSAAAWKKVFGALGGGKDLFLSDPSYFFDIIQRRRNRNAGSFCCGAGSIHRREAVYENALFRQGKALAGHSQGLPAFASQKLLKRIDLQPFRFHVSEDIFTSIQHHQRRWKSVYHPHVQARMLSPWSAPAWAIQKLKYAGGTFDIMVNANPILCRRMSWRVQLHYLATFWSYLSVLWLPVLILAPAYSMFSGKAPVDGFSAEFFLHILPVLIANEAAMNATSKGHSIAGGRILAIGTLFINWRALLQVLRGQKPHFPPTPKMPLLSASIRYAVPNLLILILLWAALIHGATQYFPADENYSTAFFVVNTFWILWTSLALIRVCKCALLKPQLPGAK